MTTEVHPGNSALHPSWVAKSSNSFGWGKGGKVSTAGWQVTLCDPIWFSVAVWWLLQTAISSLLESKSSYVKVNLMHYINANMKRTACQSSHLASRFLYSVNLCSSESSSCLKSFSCSRNAKIASLNCALKHTNTMIFSHSIDTQKGAVV